VRVFQTGGAWTTATEAAGPCVPEKHSAGVGGAFADDDDLGAAIYIYIWSFRRGFYPFRIGYSTSHNLKWVQPKHGESKNVWTFSLNNKI